jgi:hypothetical protein
MLLFIPALALDLFWSRTRKWNQWTLAAVSGLIFLGVLIAVQWPFSSFLNSGGSENWFFHTNIYDYNQRPTSIIVRHVFVSPDSASTFWTNLSLAAVFAFISTRLGFAWGDWMRRIRR